MTNVKIKVDPQEKNGVRLNTTATAMTITAIGDISDGGGGSETKKELVVTILEYDEGYNPTSISVSSNYKDVMREEDINNISIKLVAGSDEGICHVLSKSFDSEYNETTIRFVTPDDWNFKYFQITADGGRTLDVVHNIIANVDVLANNPSSPTVTVES